MICINGKWNRYSPHEKSILSPIIFRGLKNNAAQTIIIAKAAGNKISVFVKYRNMNAKKAGKIKNFLTFKNQFQFKNIKIPDTKNEMKPGN